jgi:uncharacterized MAPEG superfamily protein
MTVALWCLPVAVLLPYVFTVVAKGLVIRQTRRFDNHDPRGFLEQAEGAAKRAHYTQLNTFEALPGFVAGVLTASFLGADQAALDGLAVAWVVLRLLYGVCYITDRATLRSLVWMAAAGCALAMFVLAAVAVPAG